MTKRTKGRDLNRYLYISVYSSIIHNSQKVQTTQVSTDKYSKCRVQYIQTVECHLALKRKEILTDALQHG